MKKDGSDALGELAELCLRIEGQLRSQMVTLVRIENRLAASMPSRAVLDRRLEEGRLTPTMEAWAQIQVIVQDAYPGLVAALRALRGAVPTPGPSGFEVWGELACAIEIRALEPDLFDIPVDVLGDPN